LDNTAARKLAAGQFAIKKPGFFGKAGLLLAKLTHYQKVREENADRKFGKRTRTNADRTDIRR